MWLIVCQSLAEGFIPINTWQQRTLFKPGMLERKVYNNDDISVTLFSVLKFAKPSCDNVLQPSPLHASGCNTLSHSGCNTLSHLGLANVNIWKRIFYPLSVAQMSCHSVASGSALFVMIKPSFTVIPTRLRVSCSGPNCLQVSLVINSLSASVIY